MKASRSRHWLCAAVALALAFAASAQTPGGAGPKAGNRSGGGSLMRPGEDRVVGPGMVELVTMRVGQLEEDLNLRPDQLGAWKVYRDRIMQLLEDQRRALRAASAYTASDTSAPKRLDALADAARNRLTAVEEIVDAGKALYASLTPEQRTLADRRLALPLATLSGSDTGADVLPRAAQRPQGSEASPAAGTRP
jgi:Spy/CpxP family protein refolding chaperone